MEFHIQNKWDSPTSDTDQVSEGRNPTTLGLVFTLEGVCSVLDKPGCFLIRVSWISFHASENSHQHFHSHCLLLKSHVAFLIHQCFILFFWCSVVQRACFGQADRKGSLLSLILNKLLCQELWLDYRLDSHSSVTSSPKASCWTQTWLPHPHHVCMSIAVRTFPRSHLPCLLRCVVLCDSKSWGRKVGSTQLVTSVKTACLELRMTSGVGEAGGDTLPPTFSPTTPHRPAGCVLTGGGQNRLNLA